MPRKINNATKQLFAKIRDYTDFLPEGLSGDIFRHALDDGADPNASFDGRSLFEHVMENRSMFGDHDDNERQRRSAIEILVSHGMRLDAPHWLPEVLLYFPGIPEEVRRFAKRKNLLGATDDETRASVFLFGLRTGALEGVPDDLFRREAHLVSSRELVKWVLKDNGMNLFFAPRKMRSDRELVLLAVNSRFNRGSAWRCAASVLRGSASFVLAVVAREGEALEFVPRKFRADRRIVKAAVRAAGERALRYASAKLRKDAALQALALQIDGEIS